MSELDTLLQDPWLARKLDRQRRLREHREYIDRYVPELLTLPPGLVIDIGPGGGELLELAREMGHDPWGVDAVTGEGGMGDEYLRASKLLCAKHDVPVSYIGLETFVTRCQSVDHTFLGAAVLINARGSFEQGMARFMEGPPHHETQRSDLLSWKINSETFDWLQLTFLQFKRMLRDDGRLLIAGNGARNQHEAETMILGASEASGLTLVERFDERTWKWRK